MLELFCQHFVPRVNIISFLIVSEAVHSFTHRHYKWKENKSTDWCVLVHVTCLLQVASIKRHHGKSGLPSEVLEMGVFSPPALHPVLFHREDIWQFFLKQVKSTPQTSKQLMEDKGTPWKYSRQPWKIKLVDRVETGGDFVFVLEKDSRTSMLVHTWHSSVFLDLFKFFIVYMFVSSALVFADIHCHLFTPSA